MLNNHTPRPPLEPSPEEMYWMAGYLVALYLVGRSGAMAWFCLMLIPVVIVIVVLVTWDDW